MIHEQPILKLNVLSESTRRVLYITHSQTKKKIAFTKHRQEDTQLHCVTTEKNTARGCVEREKSGFSILVKI